MCLYYSFILMQFKNLPWFHSCIRAIYMTHSLIVVYIQVKLQWNHLSQQQKCFEKLKINLKSVINYSSQKQKLNSFICLLASRGLVPTYLWNFFLLTMLLQIEKKENCLISKLTQSILLMGTRAKLIVK